MFLQFLCALVLVLAILLVNLVGVVIIVKKCIVTIAVICIVDSIGVYQICGTSPGGKKKGGVPKRPGFLLGSTPLRAGR